STVPLLCLFFVTTPPPPISTLFPYTTLFRSDGGLDHHLVHRAFVVIGKALALVADPLHARRHLDEPQRRRRPGNSIFPFPVGRLDRKSTRLNSSHVKISYAVFCLKKKKETNV